MAQSHTNHSVWRYTMRTLILGSLISLGLVLPAIAGEQAPFDAAARAKVVAPFMDAETVAVLHADPTRLDVDALIEQIVALVPEAAQDMQEARQGMKTALGVWTKTGAKDVYMVISLADYGLAG